MNQKLQNDLKQLTEKPTTSFQKKMKPMQQEMQCLKNKAKNISEKNTKLSSKIESIIQKKKPGNNHTPTTHNETNEIKNP